MYQPNSGWTFPTLNARIYNNGRGYSITNLPGNTNQEEIGTMEGAELEVFGHTIVINPDASLASRKYGDINSDGLINAKDASLILMYSAYCGTTPTPLTLDEWLATNS